MAVRENPRIECVVMGKHGLVTWDADPRPRFDQTNPIISEAEEFIAERARGKRVFGPVEVAALAPERRREIAAWILPVLRGAVSQAARSVVAFDDSEAVLDFVGTERAREIASVGAACPDHLVHTKHWPLFIDWDAHAGDLEGLASQVRDGVAAYMAQYENYFKEHAAPGD